MIRHTLYEIPSYCINEITYLKVITKARNIWVFAFYKYKRTNTTSVVTVVGG